MRYSVVLLGFSIVVALWGCSGTRQTEYKEYYQKLIEKTPEESQEFFYDISNHAQDISNPDALRYFRDLYGLSALEDQTLYWDDETLQLSYYFSMDVPFHQIDTARTYAINRLVLGSINKGNPTPYEYWMIEGGTRRNIATVSCRVFIGDELVLQDNYAEKKLIGFYENDKSIFPARQFNPENEAEILKLVSHYMDRPELVFQKGICNGAWIIHLQSDRIPAPEKIEAMLIEWKKEGFCVNPCSFIFWADGEMYYFQDGAVDLILSHFLTGSLSA